MANLKLREQAMPTGLTLFGPLPETTDFYLLWAGPGAGLNLAIKPFDASGTLTRIYHSTADGNYQTRAEARKAANAFAEYGQ